MPLRILVRALPAAALALLATTASLGGPIGTAAAADEIRAITFPVEGRVSFSDTFGAPRSGGRTHAGADLMGTKLQRLVAAAEGTITWLRFDPLAGNNLVITDRDGWTYHYVHINNDTPGTDDGANPREWAFVGGLKVGDTVRAGQHIAYLGDSGNAEDTAPHLHFEIHRPDGSVLNPTASVQAAQEPVREAMWLADARGRVFTLGQAGFYGDTAAMTLNGPVVGMAPTTSGRGYWLLGADGGVFSHGDAAFWGSTGGMRLVQPVNGMAPTPTGAGYWLVASDGGIFAFGDAPFWGSTGALRLVQPVNGMPPTPTGAGYWLVASDGGIFAFGDAPFFGSAAGGRFSAPTVGIAPMPDGSGYWVAASNGRVAAFGRAVHHGERSAATGSIARIQAAPDGNGYWLIGTDGTVHPYGSAMVMTGTARSTSGIVAAAVR